MPRNDGTCPNLPLVDLKFAGGHIRRGVDPKRFRWTPWPDGPSDFDIAQWMPSKDR